MFWNREAWALGVSYRGDDSELDAALTAIAAQYGGKRRQVGSGHPYRDLGFNFRDRIAADTARSEMLALRPGVVAATSVQPEN